MTPDRRKSAARRLLAFVASWFVRDGPRPDCLLVILRADTNRRDRGPVVYVRRFSVLTACAAALLLGSLQFGLAADLRVAPPQRAPLPPGPFNWTGFYVGGELGFDFATAKYVRPQSTQSDIWIGSANRGLVSGSMRVQLSRPCPGAGAGRRPELSRAAPVGQIRLSASHQVPGSLRGARRHRHHAGRDGLRQGRPCLDRRGRGFTDTFADARGERSRSASKGWSRRIALRLEGSTHADKRCC